MKTSELKGAALDWAVAKCEGYQISKMYAFDGESACMGWIGHDYSPSTDWSQGGPIIEREKLSIEYGYGIKSDQYLASICKSGYPYMFKRHNGDGPTPLIAAMRCYVASKLGDNVQIPDTLKA